MNFDKLEQSIKNLNAVVNKFPIGAISSNDFKPVEEKMQTARMSLMHTNARFLILAAKIKQYIDNRQQRKKEIKGVLQDVTSDTLVNTKAIKLCLHSITALSILNEEEGTVEDQKKLDINMEKLFNLNEKIMAIQKNIEEASQVQLNLKIECQKALFNHKNFLREQEQIRSEKLQETNPEIMNTKSQMEKTLRKINIMKKLIRIFIATSDDMLANKLLLEMLEKHRESINVETIMKMAESEELADM
ncbi:chromosome partition protein Smc-like [Linepithema humile]|uniref:chromosome partition protein Smc-like n=1 Tax=Linepithema humile TaxID=83485 RepID=UPI0006235F06|nr:PREDICTED: uncharacterized protein LOC105679532 [Linepithema humile]